MKKYKITILGRTCFIATEKDEFFMRRVETTINEEMKALQTSMPQADYLDLCIVYLFLLYEKIETMHGSIKKMEKSSLEAKRLIQNLQREIIKELTNLSVSNKL